MTLGGGDRPERVIGPRRSPPICWTSSAFPRCSAGRSSTGEDRARPRSASWSSVTACGSGASAPTRRSSVGTSQLDGQLVQRRRRHAGVRSGSRRSGRPARSCGRRLTLTARRDRSRRPLAAAVRPAARRRQRRAGAAGDDGDCRPSRTRIPRTNTGISITVRPLLDKVVAGVRGTLLALMSMVTFVLLIACANVASSMLARASGRQQEVAVRLALGCEPVARRSATADREPAARVWPARASASPLAVVGRPLARDHAAGRQSCRGSRTSGSTSASISPRRSRRWSPAS